MTPQKIVAELLSRALTYGQFGPYKVTFDGEHALTIDIRESK
ncbi:hypothetical protein [Trueperella pyogenes]|nr:hypothetical protein [Trueperella pyogenes]WHU57077.1 hypothetical protein QEV10_10160 [Trueperella pyogenes]